jgi:MtrB/PioB family decaheme-associated outer membrane protein
MTMRTGLLVMVAAALLLVAAGARAQDTPKPAPTPAAGSEFVGANQIDFGVRGTIFGDNSDEARFQRYRDLRDGGTIDLFRFTNETNAYRLNLQGDHVGYRDQRFSGSYNNFGKVKASFEWNQVPLYYSDTTATLYTSGGGVLTLPDSVQSGIQNKTQTVFGAVTSATPVTLRVKRDIADFRVNYSASPNVDLGLTFRNTQRQGASPQSVNFGFSDAIEVPFPTDSRTTDLGASLQWANDHAIAKVAYDGSFFRNNISTLTWDNPLRVTDDPTAGAAIGRMALAPNTDLNTGSALASFKLPAHSRATGYVSISNVTNNDALIPFTTNSALPTIALDRPTAELTARVTATTFTFNSSPTSYLWLNARYRGYVYDNRSPEFFVGQTVNYDTSVASLNEGTELFGFTRHTFDGDVSVTPYRYVAFRGGYTKETIDHTNPSTGAVTRYVEKTTEDIGRASVDLTNVGWLTLRGIYEHSKRVGAGLDLEALIDIGEQPSLRQFDIADRTKDSFRGIFTVTPVSQFSVNASAGIGKEDYPGANFGLRNNNNHVYSIGFDFVPIDAVSAGFTYGYEKYDALQGSRTATPLPAGGSLDDPTQQFNDPRRNWTDDSSDKVHTWNASLDLLKLIPKTELKFGYDYSKADSTYVYGITPDAIAANLFAAPVQLPSVTNKLQRGTVDGRYFITSHLAAGLVYWYDKYDVNDFALGPRTSLASPATASSTLMMLGYYYRPYSANTFWAKLSYLW